MTAETIVCHFNTGPGGDQMIEARFEFVQAVMNEAGEKSLTHKVRATAQSSTTFYRTM